MTYSSNIEQKIIEASIACIEKYGFRNATVRRIAKEAGVNTAAINYYFRTKEQLMERVMEVTLKNAFDWGHFESSAGYPPKQRLSAILDLLTAGAQAFPEITMAHFITPIQERNVGSSTVLRQFNGFLETLYDDLVARGVMPGEGLRQALIQAVSASLLGIGLLLGLYGNFSGQDLRDPQARARYISRLVDGVL